MKEPVVIRTVAEFDEIFGKGASAPLLILAREIVMANEEPAKVVDENWTLDATLNERGETFLAIHFNGGVRMALATETKAIREWIENDRARYQARCQMMAAAPEMARLLVKIEEGLVDHCFVCGRTNGHVDGCGIRVVLRKAGVMM